MVMGKLGRAWLGAWCGACVMWLGWEILHECTTLIGEVRLEGLDG